MQQVKEIVPADYSKIYLERGSDNYVSLEVLTKSNPKGLLGVKGESKSNKIKPVTCNRIISEEALRYAGENLESVIAFCKPFEAKKTKKGNKLNIETPKGNQSAAAGDYVIKFGNRVDVYSEEEFSLLYESDKGSVWLVSD